LVVEARFAHAIALEDAGRPEEALEQYRALLQEQPQHADAWHNHGLLLARLGRLPEAEQSHRRYVSLFPEEARAHSDLADVLLALVRYAEALEHASRAAELPSAGHLPPFTAGLACAMLERFEESKAWFARAASSNPAAFQAFIARHTATGALDRDLDPRAIWLIRKFDPFEACDWRERERYIERFARLASEPRPLAAPPLVFRSLVLPLPLQVRRRLADAVADAVVARAAPLRASASPARSSRPARIGYVSPDFRTHPTGILSAPIFRLHDRERFEVHAFSLAPGDESVWRSEIENAAGRFHSLVGLSLERALALIREQQIDVLIDLAGLTTGAAPELFGARAAPVQVSYLGFPGTSGTGIVDYLICDEVLVPEEEAAAYGEALAYLPETFWVCSADATPAPTATRRDAGLPADAVVLYAHHPGQKVEPEVFTAWMEILAAVPAAVLWLLDDRPGMRANLLREAQARGIGPDRLVFAPRVPYDAYRARIGLADLALDTRIYNGGATTLDALLAGVPVLTCSGPGFAGRMAASALHAAGLSDLVFPDLASYATGAIRLASNAGERVRMKERVASARRSPLFDVERRTRQLEAAYEQMLSRAAAGGPPRTFRVPG
jgi:predicted O-linked N-acetylglucosamine transferase (SPINDLY family)